MKQKRIPKKGLRWNLPNKKKQGWPKINLRKIFEVDFKKMELTCETAREKQKRDCHGGKELVQWIGEKKEEETC